MSVYAMQPCSEQEQENNGHKVVGKLSVPLSLAGGGVRVFLLDSTSMEPLLRKGAYIGVDTTQKQIVSGELYAVNLPYEGVGIKRVFPNCANSQIILRSENAQHPELSLPLDTLSETIFGRVVWALNKY